MAVAPAGGALGGETSSSDARAAEILAAASFKGGLAVHVNCGDGVLTAALGMKGGKCLVHGLGRNRESVRKAREYIASRGLYGAVSADLWDGKTLPYPANTVNLVVCEVETEVAPEEVQRVLAPGGVACTWEEGTWKTIVKPVPAEYDDWSHYLYDASGNPVSKDTAVGFPRHLQWVGRPRWSRNHDHLSSISACVSAGGRIFYIIDEGSRYSVLVPAQFELVARDAYSGVVLWKRPISEWQNHMWDNKTGPAYLPRRLVASKHKVYVTLGFGAPVVALDAATGKDLLTYKGTEETSEIIHLEDALYLLAGRDTEKSRFDYAWKLLPKSVLAVNESTGAIRWNKQLQATARMTLACDADGAYIYDEGCVTALARSDGSVRWRSDVLEKRSGFPTTITPLLVVQEGIVLVMDGGYRVTAFQAKDGAKLWEAARPVPIGFKSPDEIFVMGGVAWWRQPEKPEKNVPFVGRDLRTGAVRKRFVPDFAGGLPSATQGGHPRCHMARATIKHFITSIINIELIDPEKETGTAFPWVRGACLFGILPANGMLYAPQHPCHCIMSAKMNGFVAMSSISALEKGGPIADDAKRTESCGEAPGPTSPTREETGDWPTYRHDALRSGTAGCTVPASLTEVWKATLGGRITPPTIASGRVFVASPERHALYALNADSGDRAWYFIAGGPIDSPPTIADGRCIFGCADGWIYCLSAADGALLWRFRGAPLDRRMVAWERLESVWPVHGSVLVLGGIVYAVAGRAPYFDGGLRFLKLDARTGAKVLERVVDRSSPPSASGRTGWALEQGTLPDILSSDGNRIFLRDAVFDLEWRRVLPTAGHLQADGGLLDDEYFHRSFWKVSSGKTPRTGFETPEAGRRFPAGRILVFNQESIYGFGQKEYRLGNPTPLEHDLFHLERKSADGSGKDRGLPCKWERRIPFHVRALVAAGQTLFAAGPPDVLDEEKVFADLYGKARASFKLPPESAAQDAALRGEKGAVLWAISADTGQKVSDCNMEALPVFDGVAAAYGRLYVSLADGTVRCLAGGD